MKNKIMIIVLIAAIGIWKFQDKIFNTESAPAVAPVAETHTNQAGVVHQRTPVTINLVISDKTYKENFTEPKNSSELLDALHSVFEMSNYEIGVSYSTYDDSSAVPAEKYDGQIVITEATTLANLIKDGKDYTPLYYVSPSGTSCYKEIQVVSLIDSNVGSIKEIDGNRLIMPNLKEPASLPFRHFIQENPIAPKVGNFENTQSLYISKLTTKEVDAAIISNGTITSKDPIFSSLRFLYTSDYKYPCFVMYSTKSIATDSLEEFKSRMNEVMASPELSKKVFTALRVTNMEAVTTENWGTIVSDMKKYNATELKAYVAPPPPASPAEKKPEAVAETNPPADQQKPSEEQMRQQIEQQKNLLQQQQREFEMQRKMQEMQHQMQLLQAQPQQQPQGGNQPGGNPQQGGQPNQQQQQPPR